MEVNPNDIENELEEFFEVKEMADSISASKLMYYNLLGSTSPVPPRGEVVFIPILHLMR